MLVAAGTYLPSTTGDQSASFNIPTDVSVFGGFNGTEAFPTQAVLDARDLASNTTLLSGDLNGDDASDWQNRTDNSERVIYQEYATGVLVDGITVYGAYSNTYQAGGAVIRNSATITLRRVTFSQNHTTTGRGGGLAANSNAEAYLYDCVFDGNSAKSGGAFSNWNANLTAEDLVVVNNESTEEGGAAFMRNRTATFTNCTFANNTSGTGLGTFYQYKGNLTMANVIIYGNTLGNSGTHELYIATTEGNSNISYSLIAGSGGSSTWNVPNATDGGNNLDADPLLADPANANVALYSGSPALNAGDQASGVNIGYYQGSGEATPSQDAEQQADLQALLNRIQIWPNPATDWIYMESPGWEGQTVALTIADVAGRTLSRQHVALGPAALRFNVSQWNPGVYIITLRTTTGQLFRQQLVKQ